MSTTLTFVTYTDKAGEFRWRLEASNGKSIATSGEGYKEKRDRDHAIDLIAKGAAKAQIKEEETAAAPAAARKVATKPKAKAAPAAAAKTAPKKAKPKATPAKQAK